MGQREARATLAVEQALRSFREVLAREFRVKRMILFGSRARGDFLHSSDVDVLIVSDDFANVDFLERIRRVARLWEGDLRLEPLCYTPEEFERKKKEIGIVAVAAEEGQEIR